MTIYEMERATGSIEVLIHLFVNGPSSKTELFKCLKPTHETIGRALVVLEKLGLIEVAAEKHFPYRQLCALTENGRALVNSPLYGWPSLLWRPEETEVRGKRILRVMTR